MSKPGKSLRKLCKRLKVRLTVKRGKKRVYKSITVLKRQCANKKKKRKVKKKKKVKKKRKRRFGSYTGEPRMLYQDSMLTYSEIQKLEKQRRFKENLENYVKTGRRRNNKRIPLALKDKEIVINIPLYNTSMISGSMNMNEDIQKLESQLRKKMAIQESIRKILKSSNLIIAEIKYNITNENFELCGYVSQNGELNIFSRGKQDEDRMSCIPPNAPTIWHTHPRVSKFYPSVEDMCTVLKTKNKITKSLIFTVVGIWTIESRKKVWRIIPKEVFHRLKTINDGLYNKSKRGKTNPGPQVLANYMAELEEVMRKAGLSWGISLTPF